MKIKHNDLLPDEKQPFLNCKLNRKKYADVLTTVVRSYSDGFVLALNGEWGTGKTTFVKMWQASLQNEEFQTIYFNAWENDFENEPMTALLGELKKLVGDETESYKSLLKKGVIITKNILPALAKGVVSKYIDAGVTLDVIEKSIDAATDLLDKEVEVYVNKKHGLLDFKIELEKYIEKKNCGKPVIFIIDELDRCRPDYAVEILEKLKHFFNVKGIVFVLSIDKIQLGHSIQGYYGSSKIDTNEYLRRFIDIEYKLPNPDEKIFCKYLYDYYQFSDFFNSPLRIKYGSLLNDGERFLTFAGKLFGTFSYTLRQQEKIFAHSRLVLRSFANNNYVFPDILMMLLHLKERESDFYNKIKENRYTIKNLVIEYEKLFSTILQEEIANVYSKTFMSIEAQLILFYNNSFIRSTNGNRYGSDLVVTRDGKEVLSFQTTIKDDKYSDKLKEFLVGRYNFEYSDFELSFLINRIDLLENVE